MTNTFLACKLQDSFLRQTSAPGANLAQDSAPEPKLKPAATSCQVLYSLLHSGLFQGVLQVASSERERHERIQRRLQHPYSVRQYDRKVTSYWIPMMNYLVYTFV